MKTEKFAKLCQKVEQAERDMERAFRRWQKLKAQATRASRTLEKNSKNEADLRDMIEPRSDRRHLLRCSDDSEGCGGDAILDRLVP